MEGLRASAGNRRTSKPRNTNVWKRTNNSRLIKYADYFLSHNDYTAVLIVIPVINASLSIIYLLSCSTFRSALVKKVRKIQYGKMTPLR